jgi:hypothetical protein
MVSHVLLSQFSRQQHTIDCLAEGVLLLNLVQLLAEHPW